MKVIKARQEKLNLSDAEVSTRAVDSPHLIANMKRHRYGLPSVETLEALARVLDLEFYFGPPREVGVTYETEIDGTAFAAIPRFDARLAAGGGAFNDDRPAASALAFRRDWLAQSGISPASAAILSVAGDSMRPTLYDADLVMIDRRRTRVRRNRIYAFVDTDGEACVKRLTEVPGRMLLIMSDNPEHETELREGPDMNRMQILGEVVWSAHSWLDRDKG